MIKTIAPFPLDMEVIVEWPPSYYTTMAAKFVIVYRKEDGERIKTINAITVHADVASIVWAEIEMWADEDGKPIFDGTPAYKDNIIITKVFTAYVNQMLSETSYRDAYAKGKKGELRTRGPVKSPTVQ